MLKVSQSQKRKEKHNKYKQTTTKKPRGNISYYEIHESLCLFHFALLLYMKGIT